MSYQIIALTPAGNEACILCQEDTGVHVSIPVWLRNNYTEGQGQLCSNCARGLRPLSPLACVSPGRNLFGSEATLGC